MAQHLTMEERERISQMQAAGCSKSEMARALGQHRGTLYRELDHNGDDDGYSAVRAQRRAEQRRSQRPRVKKMDREQTQPFVRSGLARRWSPDQIAGRLRREHPGERSAWVSRMTIYRWIDQHRRRRRNASARNSSGGSSR